MRRALHLVLTFAVLWCGLHLSEQMEANAARYSRQCVEQMILVGHCDVEDEPSADIVHACHHHCPVATNERTVPADGGTAPLVSIHDALPVTTMPSLALAPPLEPPTV